MKTLYRIFSRKAKRLPSAIRAQEPELLGSWAREVECEMRRQCNIACLKRMAAREASEKLAAMPWWRRRLEQIGRFVRRRGRNGRIPGAP